MDGLLIIDKPKGPTSHDVVARVRRAIGERRVGHTGTLDPMASGVLPLVLGRATRLARFLSASDKSYEAVVRLGVATDTYDAAGVPTRAPHEGPMPSRTAIEQMLDQFRGTFLQQPPRFSAKKIDGHRSHRLARARRSRTARLAHAHLEPPSPLEPLAPVTVTTRAIDIINLDGDRVTLRVDCSAGFYVRALAHDLGEQLGTGAHLADLRRTHSGDATLGEAVPLEVVEGDRHRALAAVLPIARMLPTLSAVVLTSEGVRRAGHGRDLGPADFEKVEEGVRPLFGFGFEKGPYPFFVRLFDSRGQLIGIARPIPSSGLLHPSVILM
jgi:tRNA pseudouridine55 synthase